MATDEMTVFLIVVVAVVALVGVGLSATSFATQRTFGGMMGGDGMMGSQNVTAQGPGGLEWGVLIVSIGFFVAAMVLVLRGRTAGRVEPAIAPSIAYTPSIREPATVPAAPSPVAEPVPELTLMRLLDEDEKRMYLEIRGHGGEMYQRDLVALGTFSKAKVTRVLDRLEAKGLVVRERHGMTNRVRIVGNIAR